MKDFAGRTAFVTGGANGVGIGLVRALLAQGCNVAIADIRPASIDAALRALDNPRPMGVEVDVSSRQDLARDAAAVEATHGIGVSVLCPGLVKSYIYASDEVRPTGLKAGAKPVNTENVKRLAAVHEFGMEPDVIAARVLEAMREDRFHIFTHPEFKDELS